MRMGPDYVYCCPTPAELRGSALPFPDGQEHASAKTGPKPKVRIQKLGASGRRAVTLLGPDGVEKTAERRALRQGNVMAMPPHTRVGKVGPCPQFRPVPPPAWPSEALVNAGLAVSTAAKSSAAASRRMCRRSRPRLRRCA